MTTQATAARILAVDEDPTLRQYFGLVLARLGYEVDLASTVSEAKHRIESGERYDCALVDYQPAADGEPGFISWCRASDPDLATVVVSAQSTPEAADECLRLGAAAFLEKPPALDRVQAELGRAVEHTRNLRHLHTLAANARDMGTAQRSLLHSNLTITNSLNVSASFHPRHDAGGDAIFTFRPAAEQQLVLLSDVSGHDLRAAFTGAYFQGYVRGMLENGVTVLETLNQFNRILVNEWQADPAVPPVSLSVTAILIDAGLHSVDVITCGAPAPYLQRASGEVFEIGAPGCPLGWMEEQLPPASTYRFAHGDQIWLWTDGLSDLAEAMGAHPLSLANSLCASQGGAMPAWLDQAADDVLAARVLPLDARVSAGALEPVCHGRYGRDGVEKVDALQEHWRASLNMALPGIDEERLWLILLCAREAVLNGCQHGCRAEADMADFRILYNRQGRFLRLHVDDPGPGHHFDVDAWERKHQHDPAEHHRGLLLIKHLAMNMERRRNGASLLIDISLAGEGSA